MSSAAVSSGQSPGPGNSSGPVRVELLVRGMTCAACAARVESRLNAIENVSATVNVATGKATVTVPSSARYGYSVRLRRCGMPAAGPGLRQRPATISREEPAENGTGKKPADETGTKEHTASCLE